MRKGLNRIAYVAIIVAIAAAGGAGAFLALGTGGHQVSEGASTSPQPNPAAHHYFTLDLDCSKGEIDEVSTAYARSGDYCWGWLDKHTYVLGDGARVTEITGNAKIGPSEGGKSGKLFIEVRGVNGGWYTIKSSSVRSGSTASFSVSVNQEITAVRLRVTPPPKQEGWISIDSSNVRVRIDAGTDEVIHHNCNEGVHEEAVQAEEASGNYCWGWLRTHTYDIGDARSVDSIVAIVKLGPNGFSGNKGDMKVEVSSDGNNWVTLYEGKIFVGGPLSVISVSTNGKLIRYIRVSSENYYIDFSDVYIVVQS